MFAEGREGRNTKLIDIPAEKIIPRENQPRKYFEEDGLRSLAQSIRENGVLQPLLVRKNPCGQFELIAGERRLRASILAGLKKVPCLLMPISEHNAAVCSLLENIQRRDLNLFEESAAIAALIGEYGLTQEEAAKKLGLAQSTVANKLRMLRFLPEEREQILQYALSERHARALLRVENPEIRQKLLREAGEKQLTVARTERLVEQLLAECAPKPVRPHALFIVKDVRVFLNTVSNALETMRSAGIPAEQVRTESDDFFEYVIRIPKTAATKSHN